MTDVQEPKYKLIEWDESQQGPRPDALEIRLYNDGAMRNEKGHFLQPHPDGHGQITTENAGILRARAIQKRQDAVGQHLAQLVTARSVGNRLIGKAEAWGAMAARVGAVVYDGKDSDKINAFRALSDVTPSKYDKGSQQAAQAPPVQQVNVDNLLVMQVMQARAGDDIEPRERLRGTMAEADSADVIEGQIADAEEHERTQKKP